MSETLTLATADYCVAGILLLIPLGIGVFYAWKDSKRVNRTEYLLGGRQMGLLAVSLSLFATFQSAISLVGIPSDLFDNGPMNTVAYIGIAVSYVISYYTVVPLMYPLKLTSIYEYLELRYESKACRLVSTCVGMLQTYCYMIVALLAPGLSLQAVTGIPFWMSVVLVGGIGTLYTAIGGIKSVVWTDAFQTCVMFAGMVLLIAKGSMAVGGIDKMWDIAEEGGRTSYKEFSFDPRVRHTWWGMFFGLGTYWFTNIYCQSSMQRLASMKTMASAKRSQLIEVPLTLLYGVFLALIGMTMYAYFYVKRCSPFNAGFITNRNQIVPFFMMHVLQDLPGMAGLYTATLFSGALSTLSSGINSLAANTVEDVLGGCLSTVTELRATMITKAVSFLFGFSIIGLTYLGRSLEGPVTQMGLSAVGACGSTVLGMFVMGCCVPWANKYGALSGVIVSLVLNVWIAIGGRLYGKPVEHLTPVPSDQCYSLINGSTTILYREGEHDVTMEFNDVNTSYKSYDYLGTSSTSAIGTTYSNFFYDLSYVWYSITGVTVCVVVGLIVSRLTMKGVEGNKVEARLIIPLLRRYWKVEDLKTSQEIDELCERMKTVDRDRPKNGDSVRNGSDLIDLPQEKENLIH